MIDLKRYGSVWDRNERINQNDNLNTIERVINDRGVEILSESAFLAWLDENGIKHREEVTSFADLPENDSLNTVRGVVDSNKIYIKKEIGWVPFQTIDINKINKVEEKVEDITVNARNFGAVGDGSTDDRLAILSAKDEALRLDAELYIPSGNFYVIGDLDLSDVRFIKAIGSITFSNALDRLIIEHDSRSANSKNYHFGDIYVGTVEIRGMKNAQFSIAYASHVLLYADASNSKISSIAYNSFYPGRIDLLEYDSINGGWINENKWFGGRIIETLIDGDYNHNHNIFYGATNERTGNPAKITLNRGNSNQFLNLRWEGVGNTVYCGPLTWDNVIERSWTGAPGGYQNESYNIERTDEGSGNVITNGLDKYHQRNNIFSLNLSEKKFNTSHVNISNDKFNVTTGGVYENLFETGVFEVVDSFGIQLHSDAPIWRMQVRLFDENKNIIQTSTLPDDVIQSSHFTSGTDVYRTSVNRDKIYFYFKKYPIAKFMSIAVNAHEAGAFEQLNLHLIKKVNNKTFVPVERIYKELRGITPPDGDFDIGSICWNTSSSDGSFAGWKMTDSGWKGFGELNVQYKSNSGAFIDNGTGDKRFWTIPHGLGEVPKRFGVTPTNEDTGLSGIQYVNATGNNLVVFTNTRIPAGVDNVQLHWWVEA